MATDAETNRRLLLMNFKAAVRTVLRFEGLPINVDSPSRAVDHLTSCIHKVFSHRLRKPATQGYDKLVMAVAEHSAGIRGTVARATNSSPAAPSPLHGEGGAKRWIHEALAGQEMGASIAALTADPRRLQEYYFPDALMATPDDVDQFELCASALDGDRPVPSSRSSIASLAKSPWPPLGDSSGNSPNDALLRHQRAATERDLRSVAAALSGDRGSMDQASSATSRFSLDSDDKFDPRRVSPAFEEPNSSPSPRLGGPDVDKTPMRRLHSPSLQSPSLDTTAIASISLPPSPASARRNHEGPSSHRRTPSDGAPAKTSNPNPRAKSLPHRASLSRPSTWDREPVVVPLALPQLSRDLVTSFELDSENAHFAVSEQLISAMEEATNSDLTLGGDMFRSLASEPPRELYWPPEVWKSGNPDSVSIGGGSCEPTNGTPLVPPESLMDMYRRSWGDGATDPGVATSGTDVFEDGSPKRSYNDTPPSRSEAKLQSKTLSAESTTSTVVEAARPGDTEDVLAGIGAHAMTTHSAFGDEHGSESEDDSDDDLEELMARRQELAQEISEKRPSADPVDVVQGLRFSIPAHLQQPDGDSSVGSAASLTSEYDLASMDHIRVRPRVQLSRPAVLSNYGGNSMAERTALGFLESLPTGAPDGDVPPELQLMVGENEVPQGLLPPAIAEVSFQEMDQADGGWIDVDFTKVVASPEKNRERAETQSMLRGTEDWAPPRRQIIFHQQPKLSRKEALLRQNYRCAGCGLNVARTYLNAFRYCEYLSKYFCTSCHNKQTEMIPARILSRWDFRKQYVSKFAAELLQSIHTDPLFSIRDVNPTLYRKVRSLQAARDLRLQLSSIHRYLMSCAKKPGILAEVSNLRHLIDDPDLYSVSELYQVFEGTMVPFLQTLIDRCVAHIRQCMLCTNRGYFCDICNENEIIFPFESAIISQCSECQACFHKRCWARNKGGCPKCVRIAMYRSRREEATI